jgi:CRISPR-associated Csx3 family protein
MTEKRTIDLRSLYTDTAKLAELPDYEAKARELAGEGNDVVLTGQAPIWLYLKVAHALHGKARKLVYTSPVTGEVVIFDHSPF